MAANNSTDHIHGDSALSVLAMSAGHPAIASRDDLSFTRRDENGGMQNWSVPHDQAACWHNGKQIGAHLFTEVEALAANDEDEAFDAICFAMNNPGWQPFGWGIETGFSESLAAAAIIGLRAIREGVVRYDFEAQRKKHWE